ncbi:chymotrypsinogen A-like [Aquarana catesbeiana]|uniref:chymotrypsinogen A-like n=1 Tax=Aquarana catesbeiana TaxID=8400 RepID=UPI003CC98A6D
MYSQPWVPFYPHKTVFRKVEHGFWIKVPKISIIELSGPITLPQEESPVCLASSSDVFKIGENCITTNLTYTCDSTNNQQVAAQKSTEATSDNRRQVTVPILTNDECQKYWGTKSQKNEICTGLASCMVESGAGLLCKRNRKWIMAGIASSSCSKSKPAMFTHMSAFRSWID